MRSRGFTLLELMIVLTIIAALAAIAIPNLVRAKMAANEVATIAMLKTYGTSQELYKRTDWDGNGTLEFAQNMGPNGGNGNSESLYYNIKHTSVTGMLEPGVIRAEIPSTGVTTACTPRTGYLFFVQLGTSFPTVSSYVNSKGNMIYGYGICAIPGQYSLSGMNTYQMNNNSVIFCADQGASTLIPAYNVNPTNNWLVAQ